MRECKCKIKAKLIALTVIIIIIVLLVGLCVKLLMPMLKYNKALACLNEGDYEKASVLFRELGSYKDSKDYAEKILFVYDKMIITYMNGEKTTYYYIYDSCGNLLKSEEVNDNSDTDVTESLYYVDGYPIKRVYTHESGGNSSYEWKYDEAKNLIKQTYTGERGNVTVSEYTYDSNNNMIKYFYNVTEDGYDFVSEYTYDNNGNRLSEVRTYPSISHIYTTSYEYDENCRLVQENYDQNGEHVHTYKYTYDKNGNNIKFTNITKSGIRTTEYFYDSKGNMVKTFKQEIEGQNATIKYEYDERGNVVKKIFSMNGGAESVTTYSYVGEHVFYMPNGTTIPQI